MLCTECGIHNTSDSKYCKECGAKISAEFSSLRPSAQDLEPVHDPAAQERLIRFLDMAFWHNEAGNLSAAVRAAEAVLSINANSTTAHSLLGTLYEKQGDDARAIAHFEAVLALNPESAADAAKLEQLRRGIRVKPVPAPFHQRWLPPVFGRWVASARSEPADSEDRFAARLIPGIEPAPSGAFVLGPEGETGAVLPPEASVSPAAFLRARPALISVLAGLFVLAIVLALLKPFSGVRTALRAEPLPAPAAFHAPLAAEGLRPAGAEDSRPAPLPPVTLSSRPVAALGPDPFAAPPGLRVAAVSPAPALPVRRPARSVRTRTGRTRGLPPVLPDLRAVPVASTESLAPAPVSVPAGLRPAGLTPHASVAEMPQHTVVVRSLGNSASPPDNPDTLSYSGSSDDSSLDSHIQITVSSGGKPEPAQDVSEAEGSSQAEALQQTALNLQQQGQFSQARAAYQKAIHAYRTQIADGHDAGAAQRGLQACRIGLQICQQSQ